MGDDTQIPPIIFPLTFEDEVEAIWGRSFTALSWLGLEAILQVYHQRVARERRRAQGGKQRSALIDYLRNLQAKLSHVRVALAELERAELDVVLSEHLESLGLLTPSSSAVQIYENATSRLLAEYEGSMDDQVLTASVGSAWDDFIIELEEWAHQHGHPAFARARDGENLPFVALVKALGRKLPQDFNRDLNEPVSATESAIRAALAKRKKRKN